MAECFACFGSSRKQLRQEEHATRFPARRSAAGDSKTRKKEYKKYPTPRQGVAAKSTKKDVVEAVDEGVQAFLELLRLILTH